MQPHTPIAAHAADADTMNKATDASSRAHAARAALAKGNPDPRVLLAVNYLQAAQRLLAEIVETSQTK